MQAIHSFYLGIKVETKEGTNKSEKEREKEGGKEMDRIVEYREGGRHTNNKMQKYRGNGG